jgi:16S rRNA (guanine527-N7)-methyltransferase
MIPAPFPLVGIREITSSRNPHYRLLKAILEGKGIRKYGWALISGKKVVREIARNYPKRVGGLVVRAGKSHFIKPMENYPDGTGCLILDKKLFDSIDLWGTRGPLLLVRVPSLPVWDDEDSPEGCVLFIPFQDPGNVGSVVRSAAAFGVSRIVLLKEAAHPFHPKSSRAASGTLFQIPFYQGPSIHELTCKNFPLYILDSNGEDISKIDFPARFGILPGMEGSGLPDHLRTLPAIRIPMESQVESLNAATATAIVLYSLYQK